MQRSINYGKKVIIACFSKSVVNAYFDFDPRFGLVCCQKIACRAFIASSQWSALPLILFLSWRVYSRLGKPIEKRDHLPDYFITVSKVPEIKLDDMFRWCVYQHCAEMCWLRWSGSMFYNRSLQALTKKTIHTEIGKKPHHHSRLVLKEPSEVMYLKEDIQEWKSATT